MGLRMISLLDRSTAKPIGQVSPPANERGNIARLVSSVAEVSVKSPVTGSSFDRGASTRVTVEISPEVVEATKRRS
jgi:hypothetical protein